MEKGQTIAGKYRLNRLLGTGGMASVWCATNVFTEREFAIKFMLPQVARTPEAARRFLLEAKVSARIDHPNIIEVIDVGQAEDGSLFLVMELLTGASLDVAVRRQDPPMTVAEFMTSMREVGIALAAAHRSGVVHRDLKPTNILLHTDRDGRTVPKLLDFGVSKILEEEANTSLTVVGTVLGSPLYMSPEQAMGAPGIDGRTDVFAFGGILFESLTGDRAFDAPNFNALIVTIATKQPKSIDQAAPRLLGALRSLVRDCLVTDREKRLASFDAIVERIDAMLPELRRNDVPLQAARFAVDAGTDPDATNALPAVRGDAGGTGPQASPPAMLAPATTTTPTQTARVGALSKLTLGLSPKSFGLAVGGGALVVVLGVGLAAAFSKGPAPTRGAVAGAGAAETAGVAAPRPAEPPVAPPATTNAMPDNPGVPLVSIDALPMAGRGAPAKGNGRLAVVASPGWCSVSVDGVQRGVTPLNGFDLPAGLHRVDCVSPSGQALSASLNISEGTATHYRFALGE